VTGAQESVLSNVSGDAFHAAAWMEARKIPSLRFVGPFGDPKSVFKRGQVVRIPKGTRISRPTFPGDREIVAGRTYSVILNDVYAGYVDPRDRSVVQPRLLWAGTGGYWCYADPNDVEVV